VGATVQLKTCSEEGDCTVGFPCGLTVDSLWDVFVEVWRGIMGVLEYRSSALHTSIQSFPRQNSCAQRFEVRR